MSMIFGWLKVVCSGEGRGGGERRRGKGWADDLEPCENQARRAEFGDYGGMFFSLSSSGYQMDKYNEEVEMEVCDPASVASLSV